MTKDPKIIEDWISCINDQGKGLTKWELDFMESVSEQFLEKNWISNKQEEILERIYADKTPT